MSRNAVFIAVNDKFFPYTVVFLKTLFRRYPGCPEVLAFHIGLSPKNEARLSRFPRVKPVRCSLDESEIGPAMASLDLRHADPRVSYLRFLIWTNAFKDYDRVLHLDTDLLVLGPLDELFEENEFTIFEETYRGDCPVFYNHRDPDLLRLLEEDGIRMPPVPANFGVFLAPRGCRTPADRELILYFMRRYAKFIKWADQSIINLWLAKKGIPARAASRFNFQHRLIDQDADWVKNIREARIFHFNGVDPVYRLFLMKCARLLFALPGGHKLYAAKYRSLHALLKALRNLKKYFT